MDFGHPRDLSPEILKLYITQEGVRSSFSYKSVDKPVPNATLQVTRAVGWRRESLVYKKNEVFLDTVESVNLLMSSNDSLVHVMLALEVIEHVADPAEFCKKKLATLTVPNGTIVISTINRSIRAYASAIFQLDICTS